jgi:hypothetical protein
MFIVDVLSDMYLPVPVLPKLGIASRAQLAETLATRRTHASSNK